jgi:hypothetical protein
MSNQSDAAANHDYTVINIRKLAALDIAFHGPTFILAEFAFGVFASAALGLWLMYTGFFAAHFNPWSSLMGCYLLFAALNYVPLFLYAISIVRRRSAEEEVAFELAHKKRYARKYTLQSLLLLFPLVVPVLAIYQERQQQARG